MKKTTFILIAVLCFTLLSGCTADKQVIQGDKKDGTQLNANSQQTAALDGRPKKIKVKITTDTVNIRKEKSAESQAIGQLSNGNILYVLCEEKDKSGKTWYKVDASFGVTGWIAGWLCEKTDEAINRAVKSEPGELLYNCPDKALFVELLQLEDYSLDNFLQHFGHDYRVYQEYANKIYEYKNGIKLKVSADKEVLAVALGDQSIWVQGIKKKTGDVFKDKGNEILFLITDSTFYQLVIINAETKQILRAYETGYLDITDCQIGDFLNNGSQQLYLSGHGDRVEQRDIYEVVDDDFVKVYDTNSFDLYRDDINASIKNDTLSVDVKIGNYVAYDKSLLPQRVFYDNKNTLNKNKLLSLDKEWQVVQKNGKWSINVNYTVNFAMLEYYWGPPDGGTENNSVMKSDLAKIDILLDLKDGRPVIDSVKHKMKHDDARLLRIEPMLYEEGAVVGGLSLGMTMEEAYQALGGNMKDYKESEEIELDGVTISEFCAEVVDITVENEKYSTVRGLRVGDTKEQVESLYGKPDIGFSGDDSVEYKFCFEQDGGLSVNFYRSLTVYYKNGLVSAYKLYQVILD